MIGERGRPATYEVTPAMIREGRRAYLSSRDAYPDDELVAVVYTAMERARVCG